MRANSDVVSSKFQAFQTIRACISEANLSKLIGAAGLPNLPSLPCCCARSNKNEANPGRKFHTSLGMSHNHSSVGGGELYERTPVELKKSLRHTKYQIHSFFHRDQQSQQSSHTTLPLKEVQKKASMNNIHVKYQQKLKELAAH